jgi:nucleotide-binding universal stress UspA family protein
MKIILAIDPFEKDLKLNQACLEDLKYWCRNPKVDIKPVYVISASKVSEVFQEVGEIDSILPHFVRDFAPLEVLIQPLASRKKEIEALLSYAEEQDADMIALLSQGKNSFQKKVLGSFAEALLLKSDLPLLFLKEDGVSPGQENKVLFATDFSAASKDAFHTLLGQLKGQRPEIVIFNAILLPNFVNAGPVYAHSLAVLPQSYWEERRMDALLEGQALVKLAKAEGYEAKVIIENQVALLESVLVETMKKEKVRLLAMASVSAPMQKFLLGSLSRNVIRDNIRPIWLCGSRCFALGKG